MTRGRIRALVAQYRRRLRLTHWRVDVVFDAQLSGRNSAEIAWDWSYDNAAMKLPPGWDSWSDEYAEQIVAHELLHLLLRDLEVCADDTFDHLPTDAQPLARERWRHELEGVTERLGSIITGRQIPA